MEQARVRFLPDCVWAEDWPFDLELLLHCDRLYFLDTVFTHYRVGRQGSLLTDAKNLPKRFRGLAAAQRRLARLSANGTADAAAYAARPACPISSSCARSTPTAPRSAPAATGGCSSG